MVIYQNIDFYNRKFFAKIVFLLFDITAFLSDVYTRRHGYALEKLQEKLSNLSEETKFLYNKIDERNQITINGKGSLEFVDISNFKVLARGEMKIQ